MPLRDVSDALIYSIYRRIQHQPLQIFPEQYGVPSIVTASQHGDDAEAAAVYSIYHTVRGGTYLGTALLPNRHPNNTSAAVAAAAAATASAASVGTPFQAQAPRATGHGEIQIDWIVAYWNIVDALRYSRAATRRALWRLAVGFWARLTSVAGRLLLLALVGSGVLYLVWR